MNTKTKDALYDLADAVEQLAMAGQIANGLQTTSEVVQKCENMKAAIQLDKTIMVDMEVK